MIEQSAAGTFLKRDVLISDGETLLIEIKRKGTKKLSVFATLPDGVTDIRFSVLPDACKVAPSYSAG